MRLMQHNPIEPIPEVIYKAPNTSPDVMPNVKIYDNIESKAKDPQIMSNENLILFSIFGTKLTKNLIAII